jgi:Spy/CpxP family protein refolding chaperone
MKKKLLVVTVMLVVSAAMFLNAQAGLRGKGQERGRHFQALLANENFIPVRLLLQAKDKIGLSAEQEKKLTAMSEAHEQWAIKFRADMEIQVLKLRTTLAAEQLDLKAAEGMIRAQADMHTEMAIARLHFQQDVKALLTPDQLVKITELKKEFRGQNRDGMHRRSERRRDRLN